MVTIDIYEDITPGLEARVRDALPEDGPVTVRINSYGGAVDVGYTVRNILADYSGRVTCVVDGVAASAASVIAVAGSDELVMREGAELMIHQASLGAGGNSSTLRSMADRLAKMDAQLAQVYADKAGGTPEGWMEFMEKETWFTAEEAVAAGLADRVEGRTAQAFSVERIAAKYNYRGRRASPPSEHEDKESDMSLKALAAELGWSEADMKAAFTRIKNEKVTVSGEVEVTYPADTPIVPTEKITVEPVIGDAPDEGEETSGESAPVQNAAGDNAAAGLGLTFEIGDAPEGWTASVDAESGVVTVKAPSGAEVGETVEIPVAVNGTAVPLTMKVRGLSDDDDESSEGGEEPAGGAAPTNAVTVDRHTYNELVEGNREWAKVRAERAQNARHARVDAWVQEGRISASARDEAIKVIDRDEKLAEELYGSRAANTVPRREIGNVGSGEPQSKVEALIAKGHSALKKNNRK